MAREGVIKFNAHHHTRALPTQLTALAATLNAWRSLFVQTGLIGQDPTRYEGLGFGNVSARVVDSVMPKSLRTSHAFLISGTQTGGQPHLALEHFSLVLRWNIDTNELESSGMMPPSSEALTHAAFYQAATTTQVVFHAHAPEIWSAVDRLGLPASGPEVAYGTPEMAREVERLCGCSDFAKAGVMVMRGHEDGVISFGATAEEAGCRLLALLARARGLCL